jgi:PAS domain S-box-containing protein
MTTTLREPRATGPSFPMELLARCTASSAAAWADHLAESNLIVDAEGLVLWANARACDRLGVESGRRLTVRDCDRLAPLDLSGAREEGKRFHALLTGRSPSGAPFMRGVLDSTGVRSWLRLHVTPLEADDATARWSGISFTNVSSVVESTAGHREAQLRADAILDALVEGIVLVDADDVIRYVNPATLRMLGYVDDAEIIGRRRTELPVRRFHADGREAAPPTLTSWAGESMPTRERLRYIGFPRGELWLDTQVSRLSLGDPDGKASGAVVSFVNVSEAVRAEAQCRAVVHASPLGIVLVDREGHIAMANAAAQRLLGLRREGPEAPVETRRDLGPDPPRWLPHAAGGRAHRAVAGDRPYRRGRGARASAPGRHDALAARLGGADARDRRSARGRGRPFRRLHVRDQWDIRRRSVRASLMKRGIPCPILGREIRGDPERPGPFTPRVP